MAVIGIDLGTTNSLASVWRNGKIELIPNSFGEYLTPSVVSIGEDGEVFVGKIAKEMLITNPKNTFCEFKRNMGSNYVYRAGGREYRAEELSAFVLRKLKEDAKAYLGEEITEAVISVPAYFNDDKRCATKNAAKLADLYAERLINEPSAVALKHHIGTDEDERFIIFDFGGGTLDVSLVEAFDNMVEIQAVAGDNYLGGKDFNEAIAQQFYEEQGMLKEFLPKAEQEIVLKEAELLKKELTEKNEVSRTFFLGGKEYTMSMTNQKLIHLCGDLFQRMAKPIEKVLVDSETEIEEIDKIILVGGSSKMPVVAQYIRSLSDAQVVCDESPDESIAIGVGIAAAIKERNGDVKDMILADICPFSLGTAIYDGTFSPIIQRNETLPCKRTGHYVTMRNNQTEMTFPIYQGENLIAKDNLLLGTMKVTGLPRALKGEVGADVTFMYDINGILDIQIVSGDKNLHKLIMNKNTGLSEAEVEKRLKELQKMTMHPMEKEENRLLLEKAQRIYQESSPHNQQYVLSVIHWFHEVLEEGRESRIRQAYVRVAVVLEAMEQQKFNFKEFNEDFWKDEEE